MDVLPASQGGRRLAEWPVQTVSAATEGDCHTQLHENKDKGVGQLKGTFLLFRFGALGPVM